MRRSVTLVALAVGLALVALPSHRAQAQEKTLYQRLGGYDAVAAVTDDFLSRLIAEPTFTRFFAGHSTDSRARIRQHIVNQLCIATGAPACTPGGA
jgi:truncated hemoglobin YjbI